MACENPRVIDNPRYGRGNDDYWREYFYDVYKMDFLPDRSIKIPCGVCFSCLRSKRNGYRLRLMQECRVYPNSIFLTLTFDEQYILKYKNDPNRSVRLFLDRLRKKYGKGIRHFIIGEYGETTGRFHYHGILFNVPDWIARGVEYARDNEIKDTDIDLSFRNLWKCGHVYLGYVNEKTSSYIVKYITKEDPLGRKIPRVISSHGIGSSLVHSVEAQFARDNGRSYLSSGGKIIPLPRYLLTKLYDYDERILNQLCSKFEPFKVTLQGRIYNDPIAYNKALKRYFIQMQGLGLSRVKSLNKHFQTKLKPITADSLHILSPWDPYDFNTKSEIEAIKSCFDPDFTNENPF